MLEFIRVQRTLASPTAIMLMILGMSSSMNSAMAGFKIHADKDGLAKGGVVASVIVSNSTVLQLDFVNMTQPHGIDSHYVKPAGYVFLNSHYVPSWDPVANPQGQAESITDLPLSEIADFVKLGIARAGHSIDPGAYQSDPDVYPQNDKCVIVPAPSASFLGVSGLGLIGWMRRRS